MTTFIAPPAVQTISIIVGWMSGDAIAAPIVNMNSAKAKRASVEDVRSECIWKHYQHKCSATRSCGTDVGALSKCDCAQSIVTIKSFQF
ncbi:hypothetical protein [Comamonas sp.]|uniref:hypothetical protein n=1 Tax=Comamonas sp. TaxID=34028 RepID=UPI002FCB7E26